MFRTFTYSFSRIFWSIYFVLTIGFIGFFWGYLITCSLFLISRALAPFKTLSEKISRLAETGSCLSIRLLLRMQPWLQCETNLHGILGFYRQFPNRKIVFVANHRSNLDTFLLISYIPGLRGLAKSSLFYNLPFALPMCLAGFIPVRKGSPSSYLSGVRALKVQALDQDRPVLSFPENTRCNKGFNSINKFGGSFFSLAIEGQALVIPLVIESTDKLLGRGDLFLHPFKKAKIKMLTPIPVDSSTNFIELRDSVWQQMKQAML
jgi:1-acyl-sn-glycerol-3-phosphate acyltransferase